MIKKTRQKTLLPTLKERQRYLVYKIIYDKKIYDYKSEYLKDKNVGFTNSKSINNFIVIECQNLLGIFDGSKAGLMPVDYNEKKNIGIIRLNNRYVDKVRVCLGIITKINNINVNIDTIYVTGMINKAKKFLEDNKEK
ncbi:MAG: Rpp14/Pop5 family protein [Candidatus Woesearchaeota archaeon]